MTAMPTTAITAPPATRLFIAGVDPPRLIHIQDSATRPATLRELKQQDGLIKVTIGGETSHVVLLEDEALIVLTVRCSELFALAACITPLLGAEEGPVGR